MKKSSYNFEFRSSRLLGSHGVSAEVEKWPSVMRRMGYPCFFFDGNCDVEARDYSFLVPEAHFLPLDIQEIYEAAFSSTKRPEEITALIYPVKDHLKRKLQAFLHRFDIQLQIAENALAIPLNIPLGVALTEFVAEMELPVIALHHDFFWERKRFLKNCCRMPTHTPIW